MSSLDDWIDCLPQRPPFRFVDEVTELASLRRALGAVTFARGHRVFDGHLPGDPIVPGVILVEALAQLSGLCLLRGGESAVRGFLADVARMRFRRLVRPDERVVLRTELVKRFGSTARFEVESEVRGECACNGVLTIGGASLEAPPELS